MTENEIRQLNPIALAYLGDAVYEVFIREKLVEEGGTRTGQLQRSAVKYVGAYGQAKAFDAILSQLSDEEAAVARRAKNHKISSKPKNVDPMTYKKATALEALIGYLHGTGRQERLYQLLALAVAAIDA